MILSDATASTRWPEWLIVLGQFKSYMILFAAAAVGTALSTPVYILMARRLGWVDRPWGRKRHERATVTMGGLVIFGVVFAGAFVAMSLDNRVGEMLREPDNARSIFALLACTLCMILLGVIDDRHAIRPRIKLLVQTVVALAAVSFGFHIKAVTMPFLDSLPLPPITGYALSLIWIVGITNAVNLTDGLDGLAAGICFLAAAVNALVAIWLGNYYMSVMMILLAGALLGFLRYNFHPARVFLGDTGSLALGMFLALASLQSAQKAHTALLILVPLFALGYPIFDTLLAVARRMVRGQPLFTSDRDHIHHRLLDRSRSPSSAAIQIYVVSLLLSVGCVLAAAANHLVVGLAIAGVALLAVFATRVLGYLEWGGWVSRWSGREETKILHAAAQLARLKIRSARDQLQLLLGFAIAAREIGCARVELHRGEQIIAWDEPPPPVDIAAGFESDDLSRDDAAAPFDSDEESMIEIPLGDESMLRLIFHGTVNMNDERSQLIEELSRELGERLK